MEEAVAIGTTMGQRSVHRRKCAAQVRIEQAVKAEDAGDAAHIRRPRRNRRHGTCRRFADPSRRELDEHPRALVSLSTAYEQGYVQLSARKPAGNGLIGDRVQTARLEVY